MFTYRTQVADTPVVVSYVYKSDGKPDVKSIVTDDEQKRPIHLQPEEMETLAGMLPKGA